MIVFKTENEILKDINENLGSLGISDIYDSPILASLFSPFISKVIDLNTILEQIYTQSRLSTATGEALDDIIYQITGKARMTQLPPEDLTYSNFHFYLPDDKTASDMTTDGNGFTIPAGTIVKSSSVKFYTLDDAVFNPDTSVVYVRIRALSPNTGYIEAGSIVNHEINYSSIPNFNSSDPNNEILCSNDKELTQQTYNETDDELRYRILKWIEGRSGINESTLQSKLMEIGVTDYIIHDDFYGIGKAGIEIITDHPIVSDALLVQANEIVKSIYPGNRVILPIYLPINFTMSLEVNDPANLETTKSEIIDAVNTVLKSYRLGTPLNVNDILSRARAIDNVKYLDCNCIFINGYKQSIEQKQTIPNIPCQPDEKYVIDPDSSIPVVNFVVNT